VEDVRTRPTADNLAGAIAATRASIVIDRVLALDDLWTANLRGLDSDDRAAIDQHLPELRELVIELAGALDSLAEPLKELEYVLESSSESDFDAGLDRLTNAVPGVRDTLSHMFEHEITGIGPKGATIFACQYLQEEAGDERDRLWGKYERLEGGGPPDPDLRPSFRCALYLAKVGASSALSITAFIATHGLLSFSFGMVETGAKAIREWKDSGCVEWWRTIHRDRL
jgi:hypothetical protein